MNEAVGLEALDTEPKKGYVAFDLDGTLASYDHFRGWQHIGDPIEKNVRRAKAFIARGIEVKILTARVSAVSVALNQGVTKEMVARVIKNWCKTNIGVELDVISEKDAFMICLFDDSVVQVEANTGEIVGSLDPFMKRIAEASNPVDHCPTVPEVKLDGLTLGSTDVFISEEQKDLICEGILLAGFEKAKTPNDWRGCQWAIYANTEGDAVSAQFYLTVVQAPLNGVPTNLVMCTIRSSNGTAQFATQFEGLNFQDFGRVVGGIAYQTHE